MEVQERPCDAVRRSSAPIPSTEAAKTPPAPVVNPDAAKQDKGETPEKPADKP